MPAAKSKDGVSFGANTFACQRYPAHWASSEYVVTQSAIAQGDFRQFRVAPKSARFNFDPPPVPLDTDFFEQTKLKRALSNRPHTFGETNGGDWLSGKTFAFNSPYAFGDHDAAIEAFRELYHIGCERDSVTG
jgi:hypothetical protein